MMMNDDDDDDDDRLYIAAYGRNFRGAVKAVNTPMSCHTNHHFLLTYNTIFGLLKNDNKI